MVEGASRFWLSVGVDYTLFEDVCRRCCSLVGDHKQMSDPERADTLWVLLLNDLIRCQQLRGTPRWL
jgi:hypothetical protein